GDGGNQHEAQERVQRELPLHESNREDGAAPSGPRAREPDQQRVQERLDVDAARRHQQRRRPGRRGNEEQRRGTRQRRRQTGLALERAQQEVDDDKVDAEERQFEGGNGDAEDRER